MLATLQGATGECVMMLGHNPGIAGFAENLCANPPDHPRFFDYPTCATTILDFQCGVTKVFGKRDYPGLFGMKWDEN